MKSKGKNRDTAEQQIMFNEALKKAVDEKDNAVKALEEKSKLFNDEVSATFMSVRSVSYQCSTVDFGYLGFG